MSENDTQLILKNINNHLRFKKILSFLCYFLILGSLSLYFANFFEQKQTVRIVNQIQEKKDQLKINKVMTNARIAVKHDDGKIYQISAKKAYHASDEDVTMEDVLAIADIGKISAGELKIDQAGDHLVFSKNPVLILNQ